MKQLNFARRASVLVALLMVVLISACESEPPKVAVDELPPGNPENGADLFAVSVQGATACSSCHQLNAARSSGPSLQYYGDIAGDRVDGESAEAYTYYAIIRPSRYLVRGYSNVMPSNYEDVFTEQELADLIAYLLTLKAE